MSSYGDTLVPFQEVWPMCDQYASPCDLDTGGDYPLPPPDPAQRLNFPLSAADHRRLDLYAALTVRGIAPVPGDQHAVDTISTLGDEVTTAVLRWVAGATG
ncbi:hypothetical protein ACWD1Z_06970 [Streptomyces sp. NPDC002784]